MKRTQVTDLFALIRATAVSFFSIVMFVALAVAIFLGIDWSGRALEASGEDAFDAGSFHDIEILFPYGLTDDDIAALREVEGVTDVEAGQVAFEMGKIGDDVYSVRIGSLAERIDTPLMVEGELPTSDGEIAIETLWANRHDVNIGDRVVLEGYAADAGEGDEADEAADADADAEADADAGESSTSTNQLKSGEFVVTGFMESPAFVSNSANTWGASTTATGSIDVLAWVPLASFNPDAYQDGSTLVTVRSDALRGLATLGEAYESASSALAGRIDELGKAQSTIRHDELVNKAQGKLDDAEKKLADGRTKISDAEKAISDGEKQIKDGEKQIADGEELLKTKSAELKDAKSSGRKQLNSKKSQLDKAKKKYKEARSALDKKQNKFSKAKSKFDKKVAKLDKAQAKYDKARASLDAKQADYQAALNALDKEEAKLDPSSPGYAQALAAIEAKRQALKAQKPALDAAESELAEQKAQLDAAYAAMEPKREELAEAKAKLNEAETELANQKAKLDEGVSAYENAEATYKNEIASAEAQLADGRQQLADAKAELKKARKTLKKNKKKLVDGKAELAKKETEFADAKDDVAQLKDNNYTWSVLTRSENGGVVSLESFMDVASRLRTSMASLFVLVGLFVCYSAISRLVYEQMRQIGAKKALGMRAREITASYLLYAGATVVVGGILGVLGAVIVVERIIVPVLTSSFFMPAAVWWSVPYAAIFCLVELVLILAATWFACHSVLSHRAVELLAGGAAPSSNERFFGKWEIWRRLPLYTQATVNNLLNDRRRVVGTLVGVAGCTALIVCAVTLNDDVVAGVSRQYSDVYHYDTIVRVNTDEGGALDNARADVEATECLGCTPVATRMVSLDLPDATTGVATITVPANQEEFAELVTLKSVAGATAGAQATPDDTGVWVSNAYADHYGAKPGDTINVRVGDGTAYELPIAGFFRHYLVGHQIVMSDELYNTTFGAHAIPSKLLVRKGDVAFEDLESSLSNKSYISAVVDDRSDQETLFNSFRKVSRVVVMVYLALSVIMAIVVLLNLNFMFVEEKRRDLTTLMVCGYTVADAKRYVWRDNVVLTFIGILLGIVVGMIAGYIAVVSMEISTLSLVKSPDVRACLVGVVSSLVLSTVMTLIALRRIPRLQLSDINRT